MTRCPSSSAPLATICAGLGLRQGEAFGLSPDDVDFLRGKVEVRRQVLVHGGNRLAFALPKGRKTRDAGESIKAVSEHLAHSAAGFTLRVYTHLMPSSEDRTKRAVDAALSPNPAPLVTDRSSSGHAGR